MALRIAHITDLHLDEDFPFNNKWSARQRFDKILSDIKFKEIEHIICTGDIGNHTGIQYFFERLKNTSLRITLGNHDQFSTIAKYYNTGIVHDAKRIYYSQHRNNHEFLYLDSAAGFIDKKQLDWLAEKIKSSKPILIFIHHPLLGLDLKVDQIGKLKNRERVMAILKKATVEIKVYCGHYHMQSSIVQENISQYITPAVAFQIKKDLHKIEIDTTTSGYRIIQFEHNKITSTVQMLNHAN